MRNGLMLIFLLGLTCGAAAEEGTPAAAPVAVAGTETSQRAPSAPLPPVTQRALQRAFMALVRDQVLATLPAQDDAMRQLRMLVVGVCTLNGELTGFLREDVRSLGEQLANAAQKLGDPPAVKILSAYLRTYNIDATNEEDRTRAQAAAETLPAGVAFEELPPLLRGLGLLVRCRPEANVQAHLHAFLETILPLADAPFAGVPLRPEPAEMSVGEGEVLAVPPFDAALWRPVLERLVVQGLDEQQKKNQAQEAAARLRKLPQWEWMGCYVDGARKLLQVWKQREGSARDAGEALRRSAEEDLLRSWQLRPDQPLAAGALIEAVRLRGGDRKECRLWFDRMMQARPDFIRGAHNYEWFALEPHWGGSVEEIRTFAVECLNREAYGTFLPLYGLRLLSDSFPRQSVEADWRQVWRRPQVQAALDRAFPALIAEPANAYLRQRLLLQYAVIQLHMGRYPEAAAGLARIKDAEKKIDGNIGDEIPITYRWQSWQAMQDEIYANTGPFAERIRAGEALVFAGKKEEGTAIWRAVIDSCGDERVAAYLRNRAGFVLLRQEWGRVVLNLRIAPVYYAISLQDAATARWLLEAGEDPCAKTECDDCPLFRAAAQKNEVVLLEILKRKLPAARLNAAYFNQLTPLAAAIAENTLAGVTALVEAGADVNQPDAKGQSPVLLSCLREDTLVLKFLLGKGADCKAAVPATGLQALHLAAARGKEEHVRLLLDSGAEPNAFMNDGYTALRLACKEGQRPVVQLLLERGAKPNSRGPKAKDTALITAVRRGDAGMVELLLKKGADINDTASDGGTALYYAAALNKAELVRLLLEQGADPERGVFQKQLTALSAGAHEGYAGIVRMLLEKGADPARRVGGQDALALTKKGSEDVVLLLKEALAKRAVAPQVRPSAKEQKLAREEKE